MSAIKYHLGDSILQAAFKEIDELFGTDWVGEAYKKLRKRYEEGEKAPELLWRLARATLELANIENDMARKRYLILEATSCAVEAAIYDENNINTLRWAAVATAYNSDYLFEMDKILEFKKTIVSMRKFRPDIVDRHTFHFSEVYEFHPDLSVCVKIITQYTGWFSKVLNLERFERNEEFTTKGLRLNQDDYILLFVRGRTIFNLCNLNSIEKRCVKQVFRLNGNEPSPTVGRARWYFLKSYEIEPKYLPNLLYLALTHISQGDKDEASRFLHEAVDRRVEGSNATVQAECAEILRHTMSTSLSDQ